MKTLHRAKTDWYWPGMKSDVQAYIRGCDTCQRIKHKTSKPAGLMQPLSIPPRPWHSNSMDFVKGLPNSKKQNVILVIVDRLTKYVHFIALAHPYTTAKVANLFVQNVFKFHGMPSSTVSDRDTNFTSLFWEELFRKQGVELCMSSSYHPCRINLLNIFGISFFSPGGRLYRVQIDLNLIYTISSYNHAHLIYTINSYNHAHLITRFTPIITLYKYILTTILKVKDKLRLSTRVWSSILEPLQLISLAYGLTRYLW